MNSFDNEKRTRYYGVRVGDIVNVKFYNIKNATVTKYMFMDNNAVYVKTEKGEERKVVAEYCEIIKKVEDE